MNNKNKLLSPEPDYSTIEGTESSSRTKLIRQAVQPIERDSDETKATTIQYGLLKPQRRIIRGSIIHDQS